MAGLALVQLYEVLKSKHEPERITPEEVKILLGCHVKALRTSSITSLIGGTLVWAATRRLRTLLRVNLSVGAAAFTGLWTNSRSMTSSVDHILGLDGTRMQKELANILIRNNKGEAWRWKLMSKHFYSESVYDDASDRPQIKWRTRNTFTEHVSSSRATHDADSDGYYNAAPNAPKKAACWVPNVTKAKEAYQHGPENSGSDVGEDPLDCVFGGAETTVNVHQLSASTTAGRVVTRKHKRAHRRRRMGNQEDSLGTPRYETIAS